jgi:hypothetical protein
MLGGVAVLRVVAAADVPARHAEAQVNPLVAHRQALFAAARPRFDVTVDLGQVVAGRRFFVWALAHGER